MSRSGVGTILALCVAGGPVVVIGPMLYKMLAYGYVSFKLWEWFAVPAGLQPVTCGQAMGLLTLYWLVTARAYPSYKDEHGRVCLESTTVWSDFVSFALLPWLLLLVGWLVREWS